MFLFLNSKGYTTWHFRNFSVPFDFFMMHMKMAFATFEFQIYFFVFEML